MPNPRIFVSSTCYDLKYIRDNIRSFIISMGFDPVLSERGNIFYNPLMSVEDSCLAEVKNCQMLLLIIGGRSGSQYKDTKNSITNFEYREAVKNKIPIFALLEQDVLSDYNFYVHNKQNTSIDTAKINYRAVDSIKIFDFIEEVQKNVVNNALTPFSTPNEMQLYLKQQWAGMMYNFLMEQAENKRVASVLDSLTLVNERVEFLATQILQIVGSNSDKAIAEFNQKMQKHAIINFLKRFGLSDTMKPIDIVNNTDFMDLMNKLKYPISQEKDHSYSFIVRNERGIETKFSITSEYFMQLQLDYDSLRKEALSILKKYRIM